MSEGHKRYREGSEAMQRECDGFFFFVRWFEI